MKSRFYSESDDWSLDGEKITEKKQINSIREALKHSGPLLLKHWYYRGSSKPDFILIDDLDSLDKYLMNASAGDAIDIWDISSICTMKNRLAGGKCPDEYGRIPKKGAY